MLDKSSVPKRLCNKMLKSLLKTAVFYRAIETLSKNYVANLPSANEAVSMLLKACPKPSRGGCVKDCGLMCPKCICRL